MSADPAVIRTTPAIMGSVTGCFVTNALKIKAAIGPEAIQRSISVSKL